MMVIQWTPSPPYQRASFDASASNAPCSATCLAKKGLTKNIVPHGRKGGDYHVYKVGLRNTFALRPLVLPRVHITSTLGIVWLCHMALHAMSHPCWSHMPCQLRGSFGDKNPFFAFLKELKINKNQNKI